MVDDQAGPPLDRYRLVGLLIERTALCVRHLHREVSRRIKHGPALHAARSSIPGHLGNRFLNFSSLSGHLAFLTKAAITQ